MAFSVWVFPVPGPPEMMDTGLVSAFRTASAGELKCDFLFVDEFSMVDIDLCSKLFDAINDCGRIVIVGDYNQLPSVGPVSHRIRLFRSQPDAAGLLILGKKPVNIVRCVNLGF